LFARAPLFTADPEFEAAVHALSGERREVLEKAAAAVDPETRAHRAVP